MDFSMTFFANRHNIKPMLMFIALVMMILLCLVITIRTLQSIRAGQFSNFNSMLYSTYCSTLFGSSGIKTFLPSILSGFTCFAQAIMLVHSFAFFALPMFFSICFASFCLVIFFYVLRSTYFTFCLKPIRLRTIFVELREKLVFFTMTTSFNYIYFRHNRFSNNNKRFFIIV